MPNFAEMIRDAVPTGNYAADCAIGRQLACDILSAAENDAGERQAFPMRLANLVRETVERGSWGPVEIGLFTALGSCAIN